MSRLFFFSYSHSDRNSAYALPKEDGDRKNYVDEFFNDLTKEVSALTALADDEVSYKDHKDLKIGDPWCEELTTHLSTARVLIALITPKYLRDKNKNCGKEVSVFLSRQNILETNEKYFPSRILPIFWESNYYCFRAATPSAKRLLLKYQHQQHGLPEQYPKIGLHKIRRLNSYKDYYRFISTVSERIVEISELPILPKFDGSLNYTEIPSAFICNDDDLKFSKLERPILKVSQMTPQIRVKGDAPLPGIKFPAEVK